MSDLNSSYGRPGGFATGLRVLSGDSGEQFTASPTMTPTPPALVLPQV